MTNCPDCDKATARIQLLEGALDELIAECDSTIAWRQGGMRPATDISVFAGTALSCVRKTKRFIEGVKAKC